MHTPIELYAIFPVDLFRGGTSTKHRFDYLRASPPRLPPQVFDVKVHPDTAMIDHTSGGLSLFNRPDLSFGRDWRVIPEGTTLPVDFVLTKDLTGKVFKGHYSIRAIVDMREDIWKRKLAEWADKHAVHIDRFRKG